MRTWIESDIRSAVDLLGKVKSVGDACHVIGCSSSSLKNAFERWRKKEGFEWLKAPMHYVGRGTERQQTRNGEGNTSTGPISGPHRPDTLDEVGRRPTEYARRCGDEFPSRVASSVGCHVDKGFVGVHDIDALIKPNDQAFNGSGLTGMQSGRVRLVIPDIHGDQQNRTAVDAMLEDVSLLAPDEIIQLGDFCDVSGVWTTHAPSYTSEREYSYDADIASAQRVFDELQRRAPKAKLTVLEGNHELRVEKTLARLMMKATDAQTARDLLAPDARLKFKDRGIEYIRLANFYDGLSYRGVIKRGKCYFVHGISYAKHAASIHRSLFGANICFGHTHRAQSDVGRTIATDEIGAWSPGCLCEMQPLYRHSAPTDWSHGYAIQLEERDGRFLHINVPIVGGVSLLRPLLERLRPSRAFGSAA